jgi:hypothetical protein
VVLCFGPAPTESDFPVDVDKGLVHEVDSIKVRDGMVWPDAYRDSERVMFYQVTIGSEGFFGEDSIKVKSNPQTWGSQIGQDFTANHMPKSIDYLTVHMWPDNWQR